MLILSGTQYGLPVSDAVNAGAVAALKEKGVSVNDIYVESLDIVRAPDAHRRAVLASLLKDKLATKNLSVNYINLQRHLAKRDDGGREMVECNEAPFELFVANQ